MPETNDRLLRPRAASAYLLERWAIRQSEDALARGRHHGTGPRFRKTSTRDVAYSEASLDAWAMTRLSPEEFGSTAEAQAA